MAESDWLLPFTARYRYMRVSRETGYETEQLTGFQPGGSITRNINSDTYESASVDYVGRLDIGADLVRIWLDADFVDGTTSSVALGTYLPQVSSWDITGANASCSIDLYGRLLELDEDYFDAPITVPAGTNAVEFVTQVIQDAGLTVQAEPSDYTLSTAWTFGLTSSSDDDSGGEGGSKLQAVNALLDLADFFSASTDPYGNVLLQPYYDPADRPTSHVFQEGANARFLNSATEEKDTSSIANVVITVYETEDATVIGQAIDDDPDSEWSTVNLGRRRCAVYSYSDEVTQEKANAKAQTLLQTSQAVVQKVTLQHIYTDLTTNQAVELQWPTAGISGTYTINSQDIDLGAGCLITSNLRAFQRRTTSS